MDDVDRHRDRGGPRDSRFLDLEISKVLAGEAEALCRDAAREILKDAIKARLLERLGERLHRLARVAADELANDVLANLDIEARIATRREARRSFERRAEEALSVGSGPKDGAPPEGRSASRRSRR